VVLIAGCAAGESDGRVLVVAAGGCNGVETGTATVLRWDSQRDVGRDDLGVTHENTRREGEFTGVCGRPRRVRIGVYRAGRYGRVCGPCLEAGVTVGAGDGAGS
jgi:hypothetical protein